MNPSVWVHDTLFSSRRTLSNHNRQIAPWWCSCSTEVYLKYMISARHGPASGSLLLGPPTRHRMSGQTINDEGQNLSESRATSLSAKSSLRWHSNSREAPAPLLVAGFAAHAQHILTPASAFTSSCTMMAATLNTQYLPGTCNHPNLHCTRCGTMPTTEGLQDLPQFGAPRRTVTLGRLRMCILRAKDISGAGAGDATRGLQTLSLTACRSRGGGVGGDAYAGVQYAMHLYGVHLSSSLANVQIPAGRAASAFREQCSRPS